MDFTINGKGYTLTKEQIEDRMKDVEPAAGRSGRRHFVDIGDQEFPVTQVLPTVLGLSKADLTTFRSRNILKRLGFRVVERE